MTKQILIGGTGRNGITKDVCPLFIFIFLSWFIGEFQDE